MDMIPFSALLPPPAHPAPPDSPTRQAIWAHVLVSSAARAWSASYKEWLSANRIHGSPEATARSGPCVGQPDRSTHRNQRKGPTIDLASGGDALLPMLRWIQNLAPQL